MSLTPTQSPDTEILQSGVDATLIILRDRVAAACSDIRAALLQPILAKLELLKDTPASSRHCNHGAFDGGLIMHIGDVLNIMMTVFSGTKTYLGNVTRKELLRTSMPKDEFDAREQAFIEVTAESLVTVALIHDLNKITDFRGNRHYVSNVLKSGKRSESSPYFKSDEYDPWATFRGDQLNHGTANIMFSGKGPQISSGLISLALADSISPGINASLTEAERQAIVFHAGLYEQCDKTGFMGKEHPLTIITHFADMMASRVGF